MNPIYITGHTLEGKLLMGGIFTMKDQEGFPVDTSYEICKENGHLIDWAEYLYDAGRWGIESWDRAVKEMTLLLGAEAQEVLKRYLMVIQNHVENFKEANNRLWQEKRRR